MQSEIKNCQNCKNDFTIESEDFSFYEKIKVPPPTFCSECRLVRRYLWRNERSLHKRNCDLCSKSMISMYHADSPYVVYCPTCYKSDNWDPSEYGQEYDFNKSFFDQYRELLSKVPRMSLMQSNAVNSPYSNYVESVKNVYLSYSISGEDVYYSRNVNGSKQIYDCYDTLNSEKCYENAGCDKNYNSAYIYNSKSVIDSYFIYGCANVSNSFMCTNLKGGEYFFKNEKYSKEDYKNILDSYKLDTKEGLVKAKAEFAEFYNQAIRRFINSINIVNSTGDDIRDCKDVKYTFGSIGCENTKYINRVLQLKDSMDCNSLIKCELCYEHVGGGGSGSRGLRFSVNAMPANSELDYTDSCGNCSNLFGCISLKNKQFCILNKQYSKEEYFDMVQKIKQHMADMPYVDEKGLVYRYGEFFPVELSPFGYNESTSQEYYPLDRSEILSKGYKFREAEKKDYKIGEDVFTCENNGRESTLCTMAFRVLPEEKDFYNSFKIALPTKCPNCRYFERTNFKNPLKLWRRACMKEGCKNEFETTYAPDRPEIVYCEKCYQQEVY